MLVLSRKEGEHVVIVAPDGTELRVFAVTPGHAPRLGFDAPREYAVHRSEIWDAIRRGEGR